MIVNKLENGYEIIYHSAHGLLAGKIASHISRDLYGSSRFETIMAIASHDDLQPKLENGDHLSDQGIPKNFTENSQALHEIIKRCQQLILEATRRSPYVAILVSHHMDFLYTPLANSSKKMAKFLDEQVTYRKHLTDHHGLSQISIDKDYNILLFCDRLSLILCQDQVPHMQRQIEINQTINNERYFISEKEDQTLTVSPWVFDTAQFEINVPSFIIEGSSFESIAQFRTALDNAKINFKAWKFSE